MTTGTAPKRADRWVEEWTGGNCRCLTHTLPNGRQFMLTDDGGSELPVVGEKAWLGYYDADGNGLGTGVREIVFKGLSGREVQP